MKFASSAFGGRVGSAALIALAVGGFVPAGHAANIMTSGITCQQSSVAPVKLQNTNHNFRGFANFAVESSLPQPGPTLVVCPITRASLPTHLPAGFFVDGTNGGTTQRTTCSVISMTFQGTIFGVKTFVTTSAREFGVHVVFPPAEVPFDGYFVALCELPHLAAILGITAIQP